MKVLLLLVLLLSGCGYALLANGGFVPVGSSLSSSQIYKSEASPSPTPTASPSFTYGAITNAK